MRVIYTPEIGSKAVIVCKAGNEGKRRIRNVAKFNSIQKAVQAKTFPQTGHMDGWYFGLKKLLSDEAREWDNGYSGYVSESGRVSISKNADGWSDEGFYFKVISLGGGARYAKRWLKLVSYAPRGIKEWLLAAVIMIAGILLYEKVGAVIVIIGGLILLDILFRLGCRIASKMLVRKAYNLWLNDPDD